MIAWDNFTHFSAGEFGEHADRMDAEFIALLDMARAMAGVPFVITSAWRDSTESKAHFLGKAVDLRAKDSGHRFKIVHACIMAGFCRVGVYYKTGHVHVDRNTEDEGFPQDVFWVGEGR